MRASAQGVLGTHHLFWTYDTPVVNGTTDLHGVCSQWGGGGWSGALGINCSAQNQHCTIKCGGSAGECVVTGNRLQLKVIDPQMFDAQCVAPYTRSPTTSPTISPTMPPTASPTPPAPPEEEEELSPAAVAVVAASAASCAFFAIFVLAWFLFPKTPVVLWIAKKTGLDKYCMVELHNTEVPDADENDPQKVLKLACPSCLDRQLGSADVDCPYCKFWVIPRNAEEEAEKLVCFPCCNRSYSVTREHPKRKRSNGKPGSKLPATVAFGFVNQNDLYDAQPGVVAPPKKKKKKAKAKGSSCAYPGKNCIKPCAKKSAYCSSHSCPWCDGHKPMMMVLCDACAAGEGETKARKKGTFEDLDYPAFKPGDGNGNDDDGVYFNPVPSPIVAPQQNAYGGVHEFGPNSKGKKRGSLITAKADADEDLGCTVVFSSITTLPASTRRSMPATNALK